MKSTERDEAARQELRQKAGEYLRTADKLFKAGDYDGAARNVGLAAEVDPRNPYARAFEERIRQAVEKRIKEASPGATPEEQESSTDTPPAAATEKGDTSILPPREPARPKTNLEFGSGVQDLQKKLVEVTEKLQAERASYAELVHQHEQLQTKYEQDTARLRKAEEGLAKQFQETKQQLLAERTKHEEERTRLLGMEQAKGEEGLKRLEESLRKQFQKEALARINEETARLQQDATHKVEEERKRLDSEMRSRLDEERRKSEEWKRKEQESLAAKLREKDIELSKMREDSVRELGQERAALEQDRKAFEQKRALLQAEVSAQRDELRKQEAEGRAAETESRKRLEEELARRVEEERVRLAEEMNAQLEAARLKVENEIRQQAEYELAKQRESEATAKYEEDVRRAIDEGRRLAQGKKLKTYTEKARGLVMRGEFDLALKELTKAFLLDPDYEEARSIERAIYASRQDRMRKEEEAEQLQEEQQARMREIQTKIDEQAREDREEEERKAATAATVAKSFAKAEKLFQERSFTKALREIESIFANDPGNEEALDLELTILNAMKKQEEARAVSEQRSMEGEAWRKEEEQREQRAAEQREALKKESLLTYRGMLKRAWRGGQPGKEEKAMLDVVRRSLAVTDDEDAKLVREVQVEAYTEALRSAWKAGIITNDDIDTDANLRQLYGIGREEHLVIEASVLHEIKRSQDQR